MTFTTKWFFPKTLHKFRSQKWVQTMGKWATYSMAFIILDLILHAIISVVAYLNTAPVTCTIVIAIFNSWLLYNFATYTPYQDDSQTD